MSTGEKRCEHCGALCNAADEYCKSCWKAFPKESAPEETTLEGKSISDWKLFIENQSDYYVGKFKKHEGKKFFLSLNVPALLFGFSWFFYRRMYKKGLIMYFLEAAITILISILTIVSFLPALYEYADASNEYQNYASSGKGFYYTDEEGYLTEVPEGTEISLRFRTAKNSIAPMQALMVIIPLAACVLIRLSSNWLYRDHVLKYMGTSVKGGRSIPSYFGSLIVGNILEYGINVLVVIIFSLIFLGSATILL